MNMLDSAIILLSKKSHSERELRTALEAQHSGGLGFNKALDEVISYLLSHGLVHDIRLAQDIAQRHMHKGNQFIRNILIQRKIQTDHIKEALLAIPDEKTRAWEETQIKTTNEILNARSKPVQNIIARFLAGRQFSYQVINYVIDKLNTKSVYKIKSENQSYWSKAS